MSHWTYWIRLFINMPHEILRLLFEVAMIKGIYGDEAHLFSLEQWVNVYVNQCSRAIFYASMQVKHLKDIENYELEDFLLEPTNEDGQVMSVKEAMQCCQ